MPVCPGGEIGKRKEGKPGNFVQWTKASRRGSLKSCIFSTWGPGGEIGKRKGGKPGNFVQRTKASRRGSLKSCIFSTWGPGGEIGKRKGLKIPRGEISLPVRFRPRAPCGNDAKVRACLNPEGIVGLAGAPLAVVEMTVGKARGITETKRSVRFAAGSPSLRNDSGSGHNNAV